MSAPPVRSRWLRHQRLIRCVLGLNLFFTAGTALFMYEWAHRATHGPARRAFTSYWLVQLHLGTENVVAAWYSSMLLLSVALAACLAFAVDQQQNRLGVDRWLSFGWLLLAAAFAGLSLDEIGSFHERIGMVVSLNRASLGAGSAAAVGWVYILAIPILAVAALMLAFAWLRLRRVPAACACILGGIALFLSNPLFELGEMALLRRAGAGDMAVHNLLLVIEEGVVELGGAVAFLAGVLLYVRRVGGDRPQRFRLGRRRGALVAAVGLLMTVAAAASHWAASQLPRADTGIPENWFPAALLFVIARRTAQKRQKKRHRRQAASIAAVALVLSAYFGAGLYGYSPWLALIGWPHVAVIATAASAFWLWRTV